MSTDASIASPIEILLVEDSLADIELTKVGLREGKIFNHLSVARDGEEAMRFLRREGEFADAPRPDLILLDLNLPGKDGREVLHDVKHDKVLKQIPVVILTTSQAEEDVMRAYGLHANAYMTKPVDFDGFVSVVKAISNYWFTVVELPPKP
jgi:two-component system, chemotaxis family, response regulator Rcp1